MALVSSINGNPLTEGRGVLILGDSYGEGYTPDGTVNSWINFFKDNAAKYGYTSYYSALGGAAFYREDSSKKFSTIATNLIGTLTDAQKNSIGTVIVGGGYNDRTNTRANIVNGMTELRDIIRTNLPAVKRVLVFPFGMGVQGMTSGDHAGFAYSTIIDMVTNYIDANAEVGLGTVVGNSFMALRGNGRFSSDYVHPSSSGQYIIGLLVLDVFYGNQESMVAKKFNDNYYPNFVAASGLTVSNAQPRVFTECGTFILSYHHDLTIRPTSPITLTFDGSDLIVGTFKDACIQQHGHIYIPVTATVMSSTSSPQRYQQIDGRVSIEDGTMKFSAVAINSSGTGYLTVESVGQITAKYLANPTVDGLKLY